MSAVDELNLKLRSERIQVEMESMLHGFQQEVQELLNKFGLNHVCIDFHCNKEGPHQTTMFFKKEIKEHQPEPDPKSIMFYGNNTRH